MARNMEKWKKTKHEWYLRHKALTKQRTRKTRSDRAEWLRNYKKENNICCKICAENHPACVEFHHIDPEKKVMGITKACNQGKSKEFIIEEMKKCEVLCPNCHRKLHWKKK